MDLELELNRMKAMESSGMARSAERIRQNALRYVRRVNSRANIEMLRKFGINTTDIESG